MRIPHRRRGAITSPPMRAVGAPQISSATSDAVNREAQITTVLILGFAVASLGWAVVYLASAPVHSHKSGRRLLTMWRIRPTPPQNTRREL